MLAPVPAKRSDGGSSFANLGRYLTKEADQETGEVLSRGEVMLSPALLSAETAAAEMKAVAAENPRVKDPVMHVILAWHPDEKPAPEQWQEAVKHAMNNLKDRDGVSMGDHQYMAVAHNDTDNFHVHIMANRVHPETYRANSPEWIHKTLDKTCREIEAGHGWKESPGLYKWDEEQGKAVALTREEREELREEAQKRELERGTAGTGKAARMEAFGDAESLETYCKGEPQADLNKLMQREAVNWQDVHATLATHGLTLNKGERGGYSVSSEQDGKEIRVKASDVFRKHFSGKIAREATESRLGEWEAPKDYLPHIAQKKQDYNRHREPKRDPQERDERRDERAQLRADLKARYQEYKTAHFRERQTKAVASPEIAKQREAIKEARKEERAKLREVGRLQRIQTRPERQDKSLFSEVRQIVRQEIKDQGFEFNGNRMARQAAHESVRQVKAIAKALLRSGQNYKPAKSSLKEKKVFKTPEFLKSAKEKKRDAALARYEEYKRVQKAIKAEKDERRAVTRELRGSLFSRIAGAIEARAERREDKAIADAERKARLSIALAESIKVGELAKEKAAQLKAIQDEQRKQGRAHDYRTWVTEQAKDGDRAAISQLRGWEYQDGRRAKDVERRHNELDQRDSAKPTDNGRHDPADPRIFADAKKSAVARMDWEVNTKTGDVAYQIDGKKAFTDHGERVSFGDGKDRDAIEAGLRLAAQKYEGKVTLNGSEDFKRRAVEVAAERGVPVRFANKELAIYQEAYKHQLEVERERQAARQRTEREQTPARDRDNDHDFGR